MLSIQFVCGLRGAHHFGSHFSGQAGLAGGCPLLFIIILSHRTDQNASYPYGTLGPLTLTAIPGVLVAEVY